MGKKDDASDLGSSLLVGVIGVCGFLAAHLVAQIESSLAEIEQRLRAVEVALATRHTQEAR